MTNECNILIYSVFIFFCYSFIILNMALPLFHTVKPLNYLVCFESVVCGPERSVRTAVVACPASSAHPAPQAVRATVAACPAH